MNESAVEWLVDQIKGGLGITSVMVELAKEMEKEQKESFYKIGYLDGESKVRNFNKNIYNEIFKSE